MHNLSILKSGGQLLTLLRRIVIMNTSKPKKPGAENPKWVEVKLESN